MKSTNELEFENTRTERRRNMGKKLYEEGNKGTTAHCSLANAWGMTKRIKS